MKLMFLYIFIFSTVVNSTVLATKDFPINETREIFNPIYSNSGIVASQEEIASKIGGEILQKGGNAIDAAVAVGYALAVTLPKAGNLGGGGFMLIWLAKEKKSVVINYREKAPLLANKNIFLNQNMEIIKNKSLTSYAASGVPGTVFGLNLALKKYGSMPLEEVIKPAINLAKNGIIVSHALSRSLEENKDLLLSDKSIEDIFFNEKVPKQPGDLLIQKDLALTLERIVKNGTNEFYSGETAKIIIDEMKKNNGLITIEDLQKYQALEQNTIESIYRGKKIISIPPPSSGGVTLIQMLNILENFNLKAIPFQSAQFMHILTEVQNTAYFDRNNKLGDPAFVDNPIQELMDKNMAQQKFKKINLVSHTESKLIDQGNNNKINNEKMQTTHFSILDKWGNAVANTYTLNGSYGNGKMIAGTGVILNNEMDDFTIKVGAANMFGLIQGEKNSIEPEKRPLSSMTPTIILDDSNDSITVVGAPGGSRIITQVLQFIISVVDYNYNIASAVSFPKFHSQLWPDLLYYEKGMNSDTLNLLTKQGHRIQKTLPYGSLQAVKKIGNKFFGASDPRSEGDGAFGVILK